MKGFIPNLHSGTDEEQRWKQFAVLPYHHFTYQLNYHLEQDCALPFIYLWHRSSQRSAQYVLQTPARSPNEHFQHLNTCREISQLFIVFRQHIHLAIPPPCSILGRPPCIVYVFKLHNICDVYIVQCINT